MSKELEALERLYCSGNLQLDYVLNNEHKQDYETIQEALQRLEQIENANPSKTYVIYCVNNYHHIYMNYRGKSDTFNNATVFNDICEAHKFLREKGTDTYYHWAVVDVSTLTDYDKKWVK